MSISAPNDTRIAMEPHTTEIMPESERLFIQPTEKPSTTKSDDPSFPKTLLHRREGAADGKENKQPKSVQKYEDNQLSHQDDEYISSNETRLAMEPVKPESEYVFVQRTPKSSTTEFDNSTLSSSSKTLLHRREGQVSSLGWGAADSKENKPLKSVSKNDEHEGEHLSDMDDEYISSNETMMAKEPGTTTKIKPESERLFIQPTQKPSTTELDDFGLPSSDEASSSKTLLHLREGQVSPLGWGAGNGKGKEPMRYLSNEFISSNKTKIEMEPDPTEIESLLIHPAQSASTTGFQGSDDPNLRFFPKTLFHRRKGQATPLVVNTKRAVQEKESCHSQDEEDNSKQFRKDRKEQFRMDKNEQFGMDKNEQFGIDQNKQSQMDKNEQSSMDKVGQSSMDKVEQSSMEQSEQSSMEQTGQSSMEQSQQSGMYDAFLNSDDEREPDGESYPDDGWVGDADQMHDLVLTLRWARAYRVSIQAAGIMLKMGPEIVNRALWVEATDQPIVLRVKPVIKHWLKLGFL